MILYTALFYITAHSLVLGPAYILELLLYQMNPLLYRHTANASSVSLALLQAQYLYHYVFLVSNPDLKSQGLLPTVCSLPESLSQMVWG